MFRNQYDYDVTIFSPQGRLHQVEYAMEAVKQGSATVGLKNSDYAVLLALKRSTSELSSHQKKIFTIDDHVGICIAGLTADARVLNRFLRNECLNERYVYNEPLKIKSLVTSLGNKMQAGTQGYDKRPLGVGLLVAGYDSDGPHVYQTCPSANYFNCKAMSIGSRSQSARTYLEKHLDKFLQTTLNELVRHGILALRECLPNDLELNDKNLSIAIVGKNHNFTIYDDDTIQQWLDLVSPDERKGRGSTQVPTASTAAQPDQGGDQSKPDDSSKTEPKPKSPEVEDQMAVD